MLARGTFEVSMKADPPYDTEGGVTLGRVTFDKRFQGPLTATSLVTMLAARTARPDSAGYVALERITGTLDGKAGSFCVLHLGVIDQGAQSLTIQVVPNSGTEQLAEIRGTMAIEIVDGQHFYTVDYRLD